MEVYGYDQLSGYQQFLKFLLLCSTEERNRYRFGITWGWENDRWQNTFFGGWTIPL